MYDLLLTEMSQCMSVISSVAYYSLNITVQYMSEANY